MDHEWLTRLIRSRGPYSPSMKGNGSLSLSMRPPGRLFRQYAYSQAVGSYGQLLSSTMPDDMEISCRTVTTCGTMCVEQVRYRYWMTWRAGAGQRQHAVHVEETGALQVLDVRESSAGQ